MSETSISVIVPVRDGERFLAEAIRSVLGQTRPPDEVLVVDDGSTDATPSIARGFEAVRTVRQGNAGPAAARNRGLAETTGSLVAFLDADDVWAPDKLASQLDLLARDPDLDGSIGRFRYAVEPGYDPPPSFNRERLDRDLVGRLPSVLLVRRPAFDRVGPFDESLRTGEDVDWFARAKDAGLVLGVVPRTLVTKRVHPGNLSADAAANTPRLMRVLLDSIRRQRDRAEEGPDDG